jgi:molybdopterin molybdotransferase
MIEGAGEPPGSRPPGLNDAPVTAPEEAAVAEPVQDGGRHRAGGHDHPSDGLTTVDDYLATILETVGPLPAINLQLLDAHGCLLVEDMIAPVELPSFDNSAMDGYAVRHGDVADASPENPVVLPVVGDIPAGDTQARMIASGMTARIMTGAAMPTGADAVVPVEWTDGGVARVTIRQAPEVGQHIRRRGDDVESGERILTAGTWLGAPQVGLLAAIGADRVLVRPRPRVVVLSTGSELVDPGNPIASGQIYDANSHTLAAAATEAGAIAYRVGIVPDDPAMLTETIDDQLVRADLVITSGGVSVGAYDVVKEVLSQLGTVRFDRLAMQPGMPQGFGTIGPDETPIFTLPGNPVSAYVSFEVFVRPVIRTLLDQEPIQRATVKAMCTEAFSSPPGKRQYARARLDQSGDWAEVRPVGGPGSHLLRNLAQANALIVVPEEVVEVSAGDEVDVMVLDPRS